MESRHCGQDKRIFFCPVYNASTPCLLQAFGIRCTVHTVKDPKQILGVPHTLKTAVLIYFLVLGQTAFEMSNTI